VEDGKEIAGEIYQINKKLTFKNLSSFILAGVMVGVIMGLVSSGIIYFERRAEMKQILSERDKWHQVADDLNGFMVKILYPEVGEKLKEGIDGFYNSIELPPPKEQRSAKRK